MPPGDYFLSHLSLIGKIIHNFLRSKGVFYPDHEKDIAQQINELLLVREKNILAKYKGKAKFSTFLAVVVSHLCSEIWNADYRHNLRFIPFSIFQKSKTNNDPASCLPESLSDPSCHFVIRDAIGELEMILRTYPRDRKRIEFCFKAIFHLPVTLEELPQAPVPANLRPEIEKHLAALNDHHEKMTKTVVYQHLNAIFRLARQTSTTDDAIRKWIDHHLLQIIDLLNGDPTRHAFDRKTFQYLYEYFCINQHQNIQNGSDNSSNNKIPSMHEIPTRLV